MQLSIWEKESFFAPADVIIAGGGFTGLWSAYHLKKKYPQLKITIADRGVIPTGASTRNAGFACFGSVTELMKDAAVMGEDRMLELVEMRYKGLLQIRKVFRNKEIDFSACGGYELIPSVSPVRYNELKEQVEWLNKRLHSVFDRKNTFVFADDKIKKFGFANISHLISTRLEGFLHPGKLCHLLLQKVQAMGVNILTGAEITGYEEHSDEITISTNKSFTLSAEKLLVCTNAFANQLLPQIEVIPARGQILVTSPIPSLRIKGTFHYDEGYYYFRNLGNRLLLGGGRNTAIEQETTAELNISDNIQQVLESFISDHLLPGVQYSITDRWSGIMGMGPEKMPVIKKISPRIYCAVRMSGMGVALAPVAAKKMASMILSA